MRFGLILPIQAKDEPLDTLFEELCEEVAVAEDAGFDAVFLTEFHQARGGALVSPYLLGAGLLQGTARIRFGAAVLATPLHHPVRLAEDVLMLDWISRGRVIVGLGIGHQPPDFELFAVPRNRRAAITEEAIELLGLALSGEPFDFRGRFFRSRGQVTPKPYTQPRPEFWMGSHVPAGLERAARLADLWIADPQRDVATIARLAETYRARARELGKEPRVALFREAWIGESREECEQIWAPHALAVHRLYYNVGVYQRELEPWVDEVKAREDFTIERLAPGRFLYGSGDEIRTTVSEWRELTSADYLALRMRQPGGPSHAETLDALRRFGAEVITPLSSPDGR